MPPDINDDLSSSDTLATEGMRVVLNCAAEGNPTPTIAWMREDGKKIRLCSSDKPDRQSESRLNLAFFFPTVARSWVVSQTRGPMSMTRGVSSKKGLLARAGMEEAVGKGLDKSMPLLLPGPSICPSYRLCKEKFHGLYIGGAAEKHWPQQLFCV